MPEFGTTRRDLFKLGAATAVAMPTRNLGRTGRLVGLFSVYGQASW
jgi:hypothetical protein